MISSDAYLTTVRDRLIQDGCMVTNEPIGSVQAMVGYRSNIKALSKVHLFTAVATVSEVNEAAVRDFSHRVSDYAKAQKGQMRGVQSGVMALAVLVAPKVDDAAKQVAARPFRLGAGGFAAMVQPAVVDLTEGRVHTLWRAFYAQDPTGEQGLLLPVRVDRVDPPGLLKTRIYVDLVDQNPAGARRALLSAARGARGKPTQEPEFPGGRRPTGSAGAPRFPGELPLVWSVPFHPNPFFTGRDLLLAELHASLSAPEVTGRRVALTGLGGVGKSQLAVEYAYRRRADFDLVWWVRPRWVANLARCASRSQGRVKLGG